MEKTENSSRLPRRDFIKRTATAAAVVAAAPLIKTPVYGQSQAPSANVAGANDKITVAVIGVGFGIGKNHLQGIHDKASENNTVVAAACDLFSKRRDWAKEQAGLKDSDIFVDHRKLLERKDIDAVVIATHDPWHAAITMDALEAGKYVYCEKPMTRYLDEAFKVYETVKKTGKVFQVGSQGCSAGLEQMRRNHQSRQDRHPRLGPGLLLPQQHHRRMELPDRKRDHRPERGLGTLAWAGEDEDPV